eukprot:4803443-Prorocentrum_lima.AAC.1
MSNSPTSVLHPWVAWPRGRSSSIWYSFYVAAPPWLPGRTWPCMVPLHFKLGEFRRLPIWMESLPSWSP